MNRIIVFLILIIPMRLYSQVDTITKSIVINPSQIDCTMINSQLLYYNDSKTYQDSLRYLDSINAGLRKENELLRLRIERADSLIIRIMNNRLMSRFNRENIDEIIADYNNILNKQLKEKYRYREALLKKYESYYMEIRPLLEKIQKNPYRYDDGYYIKQYKEECTRALRELSYYRFYMSDDKKQKIPYLDHIISLIESELNRHGKKDKAGNIYISDFRLILDELTN